jgi:hypothetical protein
VSKRFHAEHLEEFGYAVAAVLIAELKIAPPAVLAVMMRKFPGIIRGETEAFLANTQRGERNGAVCPDRV